jgi:hypothetical protein
MTATVSAANEPGMRRLVLLFLSIILIGVACGRPIRSGALIDAYRAAACVVPGFAKGVKPPTRGWDAEVAIAGGSKAQVQGADRNVAVRV